MIRDTRMMQKALEQRWPIKPEYRAAIIARLVKIVADPNSSPREVTAASKALMAAEQQNMADEHKLIDVRTRDIDLDRIASDLGVHPGIVIDAQGQSIEVNSRAEG